MSTSKSSKRSSNICAECRHRKVRCDGRRDVCGNCERLTLPCSFQRGDSQELEAIVERRRVRLACAHCHSLKARCSGNLPKCQRCRSKGIDCVYTSSKRTSTGASNPAWSDRASTGTPDGLSSSQHGDLSNNHPQYPHGNARGTELSYASHYNTMGQPASFVLDEATVMKALDLFFRHIHPIPVFSFLHKASIIQRYQAGLLDNALILALVGITAQLTDLGPGMKDFGSECVELAEALVMKEVGRPSVIKIQTLILIIKHHTASGRFTAAFMLLATAVRFAYALRLNCEAPNLCFLAQESRRRLMWSLFIADTMFAVGIKELTLCPAESIRIQLPCQERNFEFDLEQQTEPLPPQPGQPLSDSVPSLGLYLRVLWFRSRILQSTKEIAIAQLDAIHQVPTLIDNLVTELNDFASSLPSSFLFSDKNLHLRAYSPRLCPYILLHVWLRQCYCDLYRILLPDFKESMSHEAVSHLDSNFVSYCQWQCYEHARALSEIFRSLCNLKSGLPVMDVEIHTCAYSCTKLLFHIYRYHGASLGLTAEALNQEARRSLDLLELLPLQSVASDTMREDLRHLVHRGVSASPSTSPSPSLNNTTGQLDAHHHNPRSITRRRRHRRLTNSAADGEEDEDDRDLHVDSYHLLPRVSLMKEMQLHDGSDDLVMPVANSTEPTTTATIPHLLPPPPSSARIDIHDTAGSNVASAAGLVGRGGAGVVPLVHNHMTTTVNNNDTDMSDGIVGGTTTGAGAGASMMSYTEPTLPAVDPAHFAESNAFEGASDVGFDFLYAY